MAFQNTKPEPTTETKDKMVKPCNTGPLFLSIAKKTRLIITNKTNNKTLGTSTNKLFGIIGRGPDAEETGIICGLWHFGQR